MIYSFWRSRTNCKYRFKCIEFCMNSNYSIVRVDHHKGNVGSVDLKNLKKMIWLCIFHRKKLVTPLSFLQKRFSNQCFYIIINFLFVSENAFLCNQKHCNWCKNNECLIWNDFFKKKCECNVWFYFISYFKKINLYC